MQPWTYPFVPALPPAEHTPDGVEAMDPVGVHDTASGGRVVVEPVGGAPLRLYVCGITPYDATHLGHAATYVAFDLLRRTWLDAGFEVRHVQNVTDVDDPLLERASATGVGWRELAAQQCALFAADMEALSVLPPHAYVGVTEAMDLVAAAVQAMVESGAAYRVGDDTYFAVSAAERFGQVANLDREAMLALSAERGGDPERPGKRDPLDPLLWRAEREGEPSWEGGPLGRGRAGWHVECTAIAREHLGAHLDVLGGGSDLVFPHHEASAAHGDVLGAPPYARAYVHAGMVGLEGEKMSKSRGNLVLVSALRAEGADPAAIRLTLLAHHYRQDWSFDADQLAAAGQRLERWRAAVEPTHGPDTTVVLSAVRARMADDLDAPGALAAVDEWVTVAEAGTEPEVEGAPGVVADLVDALLGVRL